MPTIDEVLQDVDGLRQDAAQRVKRKFDSVAQLANASTEDLTNLKGIGEVMAGRIREAAVAARARASELPTGTKNKAAAAADRADRAIGSASETARSAVDDASTRARSNVHRAHASSDRAVDTAAGTTGKAMAFAKGTAILALNVSQRLVSAATSTARAALRKVGDRG